MNADELRQTAREIREKADAATTGDGPTLSRHWFSHHEMGWESNFEVIAQDEGSFIARGLDERTADYLAAFDPAVALTVADLLDEAAAMRASGFNVIGCVLADRIAAAWRGEQQ